MSYVFDFHLASGILRTRFRDQVTDEEFRDYYNVVRDLAGKIPIKGAILDYSGVASYEITSAVIRKFAASKPTVANPQFPILVIAARPHIFGASRMFQILSNESRPGLRIVKTEEEAFTALGLRDPQFQPIDHQ